MPITNIHSFLVQPGKNIEDPPPINGAEIPLEGSLYDMLREVYEKSDIECDIPIRFVPLEDGTQENECLSLLIEFTREPSHENGFLLAERLRDFTTRRSKLGLLFILLGIENDEFKLILSRFPADRGVLAEIRGRGLAVEFLERIFMKNTNSYKAALYSGSTPSQHFWRGKAVDKQLNVKTAQYWIQDFLLSDFLTTSRQGSKRVAIALRQASRAAKDLNTKREIVHAGMLIPGYDNRTISLNLLLDNFGLTSDARKTILDQLPYRELAESNFVLDAEEFKRHAKFARVELDNGGILMAPPDQFENCFRREVINQQENRFRFTTEGQIIDEHVRGR